MLRKTIIALRPWRRCRGAQRQWRCRVEFSWWGVLARSRRRPVLVASAVVPHVGGFAGAGGWHGAVLAVARRGHGSAVGGRRNRRNRVAAVRDP